MSATADHTGEWVKSSYSGGNGGQCVECRLSQQGSGVVPVRDSKVPGVALSFSAEAWQAFVAVARGEAA